MSIRVLILFLLCGCGVKRPPIPENDLPSITDKYTEIKKISEDAKSEKAKSKKKK